MSRKSHKNISFYFQTSKQLKAHVRPKHKLVKHSSMIKQGPCEKFICYTNVYS